MNLRALAFNLLISVTVSALSLAAYDRLVRRPSVLRLAALDVSELYKIKQESLADAIIKPGVTDADRVAITASATKFGSDVEKLLAQLPLECHCIVIAKPALLGDTGNIIDLTEDAKRRLGI
jgi:cytochrome c556